MGMISIKQKGNFSKTISFLNKNKNKSVNMNVLIEYAEKGLDALKQQTPKDTGLTASSWYYDITTTKEGITLSYHNSNVKDYAVIAVLIQYGHATKDNHWVEGVDYINPALAPIFDKLSKDIWKEDK